ncbi:MAG: hypothetical protein ACK2UK_18480, partial [Candidatus Promineifilaceae bacterium]
HLPAPSQPPPLHPSQRLAQPVIRHEGNLCRQKWPAPFLKSPAKMEVQKHTVDDQHQLVDADGPNREAILLI